MYMYIYVYVYVYVYTCGKVSSMIHILNIFEKDGRPSSTPRHTATAVLKLQRPRQTLPVLELGVAQGPQGLLGRHDDIQTIGI